MNKKLLNFVKVMMTLVEAKLTEDHLLQKGHDLLVELVSKDDWLPEAYAISHPSNYQKYLLYADPLDRLSVVSFVWGPGQKTPVHDHLTWGLVGCLRGRERETPYVKQVDGNYLALSPSLLHPGEVSAVSPTIGDVHEVANDLTDQATISIHVYGRNIGLVHRHAFDPVSGSERSFVSTYANNTIPNLWS